MKNVAQGLTNRRHFISVSSPPTSRGAGSAGGKEMETDRAIIQRVKSPTEFRTEEPEESTYSAWGSWGGSEGNLCFH